MIKLASPEMGDKEIEAVAEVLRSGQLVQGRRVAEFEVRLSERLEGREVIAVSSGTAALHLAFMALGIGAGDAVFIPSYAWPSSANVTLLLGAVPVLVDVDEENYNLDISSLRDRLDRCVSEGWGRPRLVVAVHQFGLPCDLNGIFEFANEKGLLVLEDAACALGAEYDGRPVGALAPIGVFSNHPRKSITTGEGGMIAVEDAAVVQRLRRLRNHGQDQNHQIVEPGLNYRMTEMQAALGLVQLDDLNRILVRKRQLAGMYIDRLKGLEAVRCPVFDQSHTWQTFMVVLDESIDRAMVIKRFRAECGVEAGIGSADAHSQPVFHGRSEWERLSVSERLANQGLALPLHAGLVDNDITQVCDALTDLLR